MKVELINGVYHFYVDGELKAKANQYDVILSLRASYLEQTDENIIYLFKQSIKKEL